MRTLRPIVYIPLLLLTQVLYGQKRKPVRKPPPSLPIRAPINNNCARTGHESLATRMTRYPFNSSGLIQLVSFDVDAFVKIAADGEFVLYSAGEQPLLLANDTSQPKQPLIKEIKSLAMPQIDTLTDILYNYGFGEGSHIISKGGCYSPRNAILFIDRNGKALAFIEICFECRNTRESSDKISLGEICDQKLSMLKDLFRKVGIRHGID